MSFQQGLSGLSASSRSLDVIGNNIANANTTGMKSSRAEFSDLYASSLGSSGGGGAGIGVEVGKVAQLFTQGNISVTGNSLDVAINGNGFFQLDMVNGSRSYSRNGTFKEDVNGNIVTNDGSKLLGISPDPTTGVILPGGKLGPLSLPSGSGIPAVATTAMAASLNLDANAAIGNILTGGDPTASPPTLVPPLATFGTSVIAYDGQGVPIPVSLYFTKSALNTWQVWTNDLTGTVPAGPPVQLGTDMAFDPATGNLDAASAWLTPVPIAMSSINGPLATIPNLDLSKVSQFGASFAITSLTQDGQKPGKLTGMSIDPSGIVMGKYDNGKQVAAGQIQLATFTNVQGLAPIGAGNWLSTPTSGAAVSGSPSAGNFGALRAGALEDSNVDLTKELVDMMTAQRSYQANAQTIKTQDQVMSTLVNLR
jgi:flagellar hook protein FlgE